MRAAAVLQHHQVRQSASHAVLLPGCTPVPARPEVGTLDAVIVPASRGAAALTGAITLAAELGVQLVVLCSRQTQARAVARLAARTPDCRVIAIDVRVHFTHEALPARTAAPVFRWAAAGRTSDLSLKRNLGLLLARLHGWGKVLFLDDDIYAASEDTEDAVGPRGFDPATVRRLGAALDSHQVAGLVCRQFADNSVVCHARRLAGRPQDNFVTGGALGVNTFDQPLPFFPDIYNEDWFFFAQHAADHELAKVGQAWQKRYQPYANPLRARQEEFGDLLAEGLYALFDQPEHPNPRPLAEWLREADTRYWESFIEARADDLSRTAELLGRRADAEAAQALGSLRAAAGQLRRITPELCTAFLRAWQADLADWQRVTLRMNGLSGWESVMHRLGLGASESEPGLLRAG